MGAPGLVQCGMHRCWRKELSQLLETISKEGEVSQACIPSTLED